MREYDVFVWRPQKVTVQANSEEEAEATARRILQIKDVEPVNIQIAKEIEITVEAVSEAPENE